jgi:hypothetical protein
VTIQFLNRRQPTSLADLDAVQVRQLEVAGRQYFGRDVSAVQLLTPPSPEVDPWASGSLCGALDLYDGVQGGEHRYDVWLTMADAGVVFRKGTTEWVAQIIQCSIQDCDDPWLENDLDEAYRSAIRAE